MDPQEVLARLSDKYSTCITYRDHGCAYSWDESFEKTDKPQIVFRTYFEPPTKFRFEWRNTDCKGVIWCDGTHNFNCYDFYNSGPIKEICESPMMAIAAVTGVSSSAAYHVPSLLLEEMRTLSRWIIFRADIVLLKMEKVEDHDCYCIQGSNQSPHDTTIWVSTHDFSLRRRNHYSVPTCDDQKIMITTRELSASETSDTAEDSLLISLHRPPNLITEKETTEFIELFRESAGRVEKRKFEVTQAMKARLLAGKRSERSFFTEISYEEAEFNTPISPSIFSSIRRD